LKFTITKFFIKTEVNLLKDYLFIWLLVRRTRRRLLQKRHAH